MGWREIYVRKESNDQQTRLARRFTASTKTEGTARTTKLVSSGKRSGWTGELRYLPHASSGFPVVFQVFPGSPWLPSMRCSESEDSSDLNSEKLFQQQPVFLLSLCFSLMFDVLHTVINSVYVQTLPTEQATSALTDFFSRVMTPSLRPLRPGHKRLLDGLPWVCHCHCQIFVRPRELGPRTRHFRVDRKRYHFRS